MTGIKLFVGLGNPGSQYENTRHNAGFWWIDQIAQSTGTRMNNEAKFFGITGKLIENNQEAWLLKPTTFMNLSGRSVSALAKFYKIPAEQILVIHDELDLPPGTCKLKKGGGHGGHNGLKDIAAQLGTNDFWRLRLGIGHPGDRNAVVNFVLHPPSKTEWQLITQTIDESATLLNQLLQGQTEQAMMKLHTKIGQK
ncbi:aminoacyl-tRNA hydrolase [Methylicorpusculum sp.]|uniref:aminoacyl-tRNA hydrolase n=1 Tax=Methylicorpusculum sp. TaxID=2713644 RepID=UPI00273048BC|nr:aminoacyl-tRNA hydrolase [Methylicorpusculum sp.]MDP2178086.1 aminoacyl-tRNA hydrolase [Methylicorpusculum sp.]MDP3529020.1 aminoacyl-tRNA hydrolase [Methylicorpusculum sp.]MDZ4153704.1 aminoacyl-tRNA hydrolase [Methylicorpusculum sp.]